jgi:hypothetical protein
MIKIIKTINENKEGIKKYSIVEISKQLKLFEMELIKKIKPTEIINYIKNEKSNQKVINILNLYKWYNNLNNYFKLFIMNQNNEINFENIDFIINLAFECHKINNHYCTFELISLFFLKSFQFQYNDFINLLNSYINS